jgi:aminopeptidase N
VGNLPEGEDVLRRSLAVAVTLAASAGLAAPASGVAVGEAAPGAIASLTDPGYSDIGQADSYYADHADPRIDVLSYDLDLHWAPSNRQLTGTATLRLRAVETSPEFRLGLADSMSVSSVTVDGLTATTRRDSGNLVVESPIQSGSTYTVTIEYAGTPQPVSAPSSRVDVPNVGWHTTRSGGAWTMQEPFGAYTWYPVNDMPADKAMYTVRLDVPDNLIGISNGQMTSRRTVGTRQVTTFTNQHPMAPYLSTVAIGDYRKYTQTGPHGVPLTYWYPAGRSDLLAPLKSVPSELSWLEKRLGTYPFASLGVVLVPSQSSAETQTMLTLGTGNYRYGNRDVREQLLHQLVHSWYGDAVTPSDWRDLWMNEGMAEHLQAAYSVAQGWKPAKHWSREFNRNDPYWREIYGPPGAYAKGQFGQTNVTYCTARMLDRLRHRLGATAFDSAMKAWPKDASFRYGNADRGDYVRWLENRTGKELSAFFDTELDDAKPKL